MKEGIHPAYSADGVVCGSCGTEWAIGSTRKGLRVSICANCHPFYTGEQRMLIDSEGQVDRFMKRLANTQQKQSAAAERGKREQPQEKRSLLKEIYGEETSQPEA